jgi:hypothetical protein
MQLASTSLEVEFKLERRGQQYDDDDGRAATIEASRFRQNPVWIEISLHSHSVVPGGFEVRS